MLIEQISKERTVISISLMQGRIRDYGKDS